MHQSGGKGVGGACVDPADKSVLEGGLFLRGCCFLRRRWDSEKGRQFGYIQIIQFFNQFTSFRFNCIAGPPRSRRRRCTSSSCRRTWRSTSGASSTFWNPGRKGGGWVRGLRVRFSRGSTTLRSEGLMQWISTPEVICNRFSHTLECIRISNVTQNDPMFNTQDHCPVYEEFVHQFVTSI